MANRHRGEIAADLDGRPRTLVLTLGALAELEDAFGVDDLVALTERFGRGRLAARDAIRFIAAGLRGAGEAVSEEEVARMTTPGGAAGFARIVGDLIAATFGGEERARGLPLADPPPFPLPSSRPRAGEGGATAAPEAGQGALGNPPPLAGEVARASGPEGAPSEAPAGSHAGDPARPF